MSNPYLIQGPALISFSGGRTSAYMLYQIIQAHGGILPDDIVVCFANTGKEREETLRFVHECGIRWNVKIHWLEYRIGEVGFEEVGFNSASRNGEPFTALIDKKGYLPNAVTRFCTSELKVRPMKKFCLSMNWTHWKNVIGLRYDEGHRVLKQLANNDARKERWTSVMPMAKAKHTKRGHVLPYWLGKNVDPINLTSPLPQGFDLGLRDLEGNCDLCMLKSRGSLKRLIRDNPGMADWWKDREASITMKSTRATAAGCRFVTEYSYSALEKEVSTQPFMPGLLEDDEDFDAECGLHCAGEAA
ncbi:3'-phosphoadenosine 5'-phosphosulfate sulfotransferase (PAPS reductase)/FAD synthetase [Phyllobacterium ifriqiyense]|uniref:3'-phosphoadenosine 5'-phosphosulfate sulfotransferase (PAPS reductase)/FAD synthetase n=1 Tax=Phyllobacterium ifriqiyense TaxID=314238 RepID=A0ABU0S809_9HYPH|nr:Nin-like protein [Phyllobacterium ifriqiyense]MDQ0996897.1 3'-phosphoadenosine 5'-phosphosulfate sulfotransferase (PAPS reductase)/FAD synthetase [Phyllobacterium ifriqiyense]